MEVCFGLPPMYRELLRTFPDIEGRRMLFTFGNTIFNPTEVVIPPQLYAHEAVHAKRQGANIDEYFAWWKEYMRDAKFRFDEELPAHVAEYHAYCKRHGDRNARAKALNEIVLRLAGPVYGCMVTQREAYRAIVERPHDEEQRTTRAV